LYQLKHIGEKYNATTCLVMHSDVETIDRMYGKKAREIIENIDIWGFRSKTIKKRFEKLYGKVNRSFLCYSGIPASNIATTQRTFKSGLKNFLFVGQLIPRKYPEVIIKALNIAFKGEDFHVTYIGTGRESENIKKLAKELNISQKVSIYGRVSRDKVFEIMKLSDCFIMLSKPETFGLVYLEAMSMGCITIGSRGEGIDGVIENGKNGFLSEAGNEKKLAELLTKISFLSDKKLIEISDNAIKTAVNLSDEKVARKYIETVVSAQSEQKYGELISG
jgi:glycosyltransferase involved in cell wall biosynthesis